MKTFKIFLTSVLVLATFTSCAPKTDTTKPKTQQINPPSTMQTIPKKGDTIAILTTNMGEIKVLLYTKDAPETAKNFIELAKAGKYDGTIFHRVINNFMIQGGDFENRNGTGGYSYKGKGTSLKDEISPNVSHVRGALSMANSGPNTSGSQFFIVQNPSGAQFLDGGYSLFGYVYVDNHLGVDYAYEYAYEGMDVVDKIAATKTTADDKPLTDVILEKVEIKTQE